MQRDKVKKKKRNSLYTYIKGQGAHRRETVYWKSACEILARQQDSSPSREKPLLYKDFLPSDCRSSRGPIFGSTELNDRLIDSAAAALPDLVGAPEEASSRQGSVIRTFGTSGTSRPSIARSQDTRANLNIVGFELTELSRIVLLQAIVPESSPSQASCQCVEIHNYIELRYKLC